MNGQDTTNNHAEAINRSTQRFFGVDHPKLWRFMELTLSLWRQFDTDYEQYVIGAPPRKQCKRLVSRHERMRLILEELDARQRTMEEALRGLASCYTDVAPDAALPQ